MCGRYALAATELELKQHFGLSRGCFMRPRFNIAPGQAIPVVYEHEARSMIDFFKWGLLSGIKTQGYINARAETLFEKPSFKRLILRQRCLIPATGYYEWRSIQGKKQPYHIQLKYNTAQPTLFAMAGIWERGFDQNGIQHETCAIITAPAPAELAQISDRMPLILSKEHYQTWLGGKKSQSDLQAVLESPLLMEARLHAYPVSNKINHPRFDTPLCLQSL